MKKSEINQAAAAAGIRHLSFKKDGTLKAMSPYFYRHQGGTEESLRTKVRNAFPDCDIIDSGDHFAEFKGGNPVSKQSHIFVIFKLKTK